MGATKVPGQRQPQAAVIATTYLYCYCQRHTAEMCTNLKDLLRGLVLSACNSSVLKTQSFHCMHAGMAIPKLLCRLHCTSSTNMLQLRNDAYDLM